MADFPYWVDLGDVLDADGNHIGAHYFHFFSDDEGDVPLEVWEDVDGPDPSGDPAKAHRIGKILMDQSDLASLKGSVEILCSFIKCTEVQQAQALKFFDNVKYKATVK